MSYEMSYTKAERAQIAKNIREYAKERRIEYWKNYNLKDDEDTRCFTRYATNYDYLWLQAVADDVIGKIKHDELHWIDKG